MRLLSCVLLGFLSAIMRPETVLDMRDEMREVVMDDKGMRLTRRLGEV